MPPAKVERVAKCVRFGGEDAPALNRGPLERWIANAPELKANAWDAPGGQRGMTPFPGLTAEDIDHLVEFLITLD